MKNTQRQKFEKGEFCEFREIARGTFFIRNPQKIPFGNFKEY